MSPQTQQWARVLVVALAPIIFLVGIAIVPYQTDLRDTAEAARLAGAEADRWLAGFLVIAVSLAAFSLAVVAIRNWLRGVGEERWSFIALPFFLVGFLLIAYCLGFLGVGTRMAIEAGANGQVFLDRAETWLIGVQLVGTVLVSIGVLALLAAFYRARVFSRNRFAVIAVALIVAAVTDYLPFGAALWVGGIAALVGFWGISQQMMLGVRQSAAPGGIAPSAPSPAA